MPSNSGARAVVPGYRIVAMASRYLPAVLDIERAGFPDPWPPSSFLAELEFAWSYFRLVGVPGPRGALREVAGYIICWRLKDELHMLRLAVAPAARRRGVGSGLLKQALHDFGRTGGGRVSLELRASNRAALDFYGSHGFEIVGRRKAYYTSDQEDAVVMVRLVVASGTERDAGDVRSAG